jgi:hypothetical protein
MRKEQITKPDGRYIIFYSFDEGEPSDEPKSIGVQPATEPEEGEERE